MWLPTNSKPSPVRRLPLADNITWTGMRWRTKNVRRMILSALLLTGFAAHASEPAVATKQMNDSEFREAGLHKLSPDELAALNRWIGEAYTPPTVDGQPDAAGDEAVAATAGGARFDPSVSQEPREFRSRIVGQFKGWMGDTRFRLENGQVWQQRTRGRYYRKLDSPEVLLIRTRLGFWKLQVLDTGKAVGVKRIR